MTVLVGILCKDGIVIGADSAATFAAGQLRTIEQRTQKIRIIDDSVILASTGEIGLGQRFAAILENAWANHHIKGHPVEIATSLSSNAIHQFGATFAQPPNIQFGALAAFPCNKKPYLCEFSIGTFQPELKDENLWYVSMGSGQMIADPFLALMRKVFWQDEQPTTQDGIFAVTWALTHAIDCNPGGINGPIQIAEMTSKKGNKARLLSDDELAEHRQNVAGVEEHLREYPKKLLGEAGADVESPPATPE